MVNIIKEEIEIEESLESRLRVICDFCNTIPIIINGSIRRIDKTNLTYIEPHRIYIKNNLYLAFNYSSDMYVNNLSKKIKLYLIKGFERLKRNETYQEKIEWHANRLLSKLNYVVHTDAIKKYIVPTLTEQQIKFVYANEADVLNVALFGMTAKEWREDNPELAKNGNIRDYTDLLHLIILNNSENTNAELIRMNIKQSDRLIRLNESARNQMKALKNNKNIKELEVLQQQVNEDNKYLIDSK